MSGRKKHKTVNEYLQYLKGNLSNRERNSLERDLQSDPFEMEAMEGLESLSPDQAEADILLLHSRMKKRIGKKRRIGWYSAAASIASLLIIGTIFLQVYDFNPEAAEKSTNEEVFAPGPSVNSEEADREEAPTGEAQLAPETKEMMNHLEPEDERTIASGIGRVSEPTAQETPIVEETRTETAGPEAAGAETAGPEAIIHVEAESAQRKGEALSDQVVSDAEAAPGEDNIPAEETGRRAERRREKSRQSEAPPTLKYELHEEEDSKLVLQPDVQTLDDIVALEQGLYAAGIQSPQPSVGFKAFKQYIEENIQMPDLKNDTTRNFVVLRFTVGSSGEISEIIPLRTPGEPFTREAIRLIKEGPSWNPATDDSGAVEEMVRLRIVFKN